jgi:hypothetical protein
MYTGKFTLLLGFVLLSCAVTAQRKKSFERPVHLSLLPGVGTNGLHPGGCVNYISLNLTSGFSKANLLFEVATVSNLNIAETRGLQVAGLANITGGNAFAGMPEKEKEALVKSGFEANLTGFQLSAITNVVLNNVFGGQATGGINVSKGALMGVQLAGLSNQVQKYSFGVQVSGVWNVSLQSMDGVQLAGVANYTAGGLYGLQLAGIFNQAGFSEGPNSLKNDDPTGVQIGLVNKAKKMNGFQIGLVNLAGRSQGTQIGLVNIYRNGKDINTRDGTAVGLINIGDFGYLAAYASDVFIQNYELSTGTYFKNGRIKENRFNKTLQNTLIYSRSNWSTNPLWGVGYGIKKMHFTKSDMPGMSAFRFFGYGLDFIHVSHQSAIARQLSLLTKAKLMAGTRLSVKLHSVYLFCSTDLNYYRNNEGTGIETLLRKIEGNETITPINDFWPGFSFGVMVR